MAAGVALVVAALALIGYNLWDAQRAADASDAVLAQLDAVIAQAREAREAGAAGASGADAAEGTSSDAASADPSAGSSSSAAFSPEPSELTWLLDKDMPTAEVDGRAYLGEVIIPALSLALPVAAEYDDAALRVSPCRYSGSYYTDDLVVCGYNYDRHFGELLSIGIGEEVYLVTVEGRTVRYTVSNRETLRATAIDQMVSNDKNSARTADWDLTLFTCDLDGSTRCAVRCVRS